mgnify:CR=1 FL=1
MIKDCSGITYFGGKKEQTAKNTRVKARVKAEALREFIVTKDRVLVWVIRLRIRIRSALVWEFTERRSA